MPYYRIKNISNPEIVGLEYPQIQSSFNQNWYNHLFIEENVVKSKINFPILQTAQLMYRAKRTDSLSAVSTSDAFIINEKILNIINKFNVSPWQYTGFQVEHRKKTFPYLYWYSYEWGYDLIDFEKSKFVAKSDSSFFDTPRTIDVKVDGLIDVLNWKRFNSVFPYLSAVELVLNEKINKYDMFQLPFGIGGYFVNDKIKQAMEKENITGFGFFGEYTNVITEYQY